MGCGPSIPPVPPITQDQSTWLRFEGKGEEELGDPDTDLGCRIYDENGELVFRIKSLKHVCGGVKTAGYIGTEDRDVASRNKPGVSQQLLSCGVYTPEGEALFTQDFPQRREHSVGGQEMKLRKNTAWQGVTNIIAHESSSRRGGKGEQGEELLLGKITGTWKCTWELDGGEYAASTSYTSVHYEGMNIWLYKGKPNTTGGEPGETKEDKNASSWPPKDQPHAAQLTITGALFGSGGSGTIASFGIPAFSAMVSPECAKDMRDPGLALFLMIYGLDSGRKFHGTIPPATYTRYHSVTH